MSIIVFFIIFNYRRSVYCWKNFNMKQVYKVKSENLHWLPKIFWWGRGNTTTVRDWHLKKERFTVMADTGLTLQTPWYENGNVLFLQPLRVGASVLLNNFFPSITPHLFPQSWAHSCELTKPRSPPGSPVPGILQARTLEWVAISFSNAWKWKGSRSIVSYSQRPRGLQPIRFLCPWDFPGKSTGVGCHCLLRYWDDSCLIWWWVVDSYRSLPAEPLKVRRILVLSSCSPWTGKKPCYLLSGVRELPPLLHHPGYPDTVKLTQIYVPRHSTQPLLWKGFADCHCPTLVLIWLCLRMAEEGDSEFLSHKPNSIKILLFTF